MITKQQVLEFLKDYDLDNITIATICSHSSLQIFDGARKEGFRTLGICVGKPPKFYDAFPRAKPDEYLVLEDYEDLINRAEELRKKNTIIIPTVHLFIILAGKISPEWLCPLSETGLR